MEAHMTSEVIIVIVVIVAVALFASVFSPMMGFRYGMMGWFAPSFFFGWIICLLIIVALVLFIIWLVRQLGEDTNKKQRSIQKRSL